MKIGTFTKTFVFLFLSSLCYGYSAREILGDVRYETLKKEGRIQINRFNDKENDLELVPNTEFSKKKFGEWKKLNLTAMAGENLYLLPKYGIVHHW